VTPRSRRSNAPAMVQMVRAGGDRFRLRDALAAFVDGMLRSIRVRRRKQCFVLCRLRAWVIDPGRTLLVRGAACVWAEQVV
jgi:hypothetical protein